MPKCDRREQQTLMLQSRWLGQNAISGHLRRFCLFFFCSVVILFYLMRTDSFPNYKETHE